MLHDFRYIVNTAVLQCWQSLLTLVAVFIDSSYPVDKVSADFVQQNRKSEQHKYL